MKTNFSDILVTEGIAIADPKLAQQYANAQKQLNDKDAQIIALQKQINNIEVQKTQIQKAMVAIEQKSAQTVIQAPMVQQPEPEQISQTGTSHPTAVQQPTMMAQESYNGILKIKKKVNETVFDISDADLEELEEVKNFMASESIPYEEPTEDTIEFDETKLDPEWRHMLTDIGIKKLDDFQQEISDEPEIELTPEEHENIDEEKVFYVQVENEGDAFIGKIYKLNDSEEWMAKVTVGESDTFDKLYYDDEWDEVDIIAFLRENYADAILISEDEFNAQVLDKTDEIQEAVKTTGRYVISKLGDYKGGNL